MIGAVLATLLFSLSAVTANRSVRYLGSNEANLWRLLLATIILGGWAFTRGVGLEGASLPWFVFSGIVGFGVGDVALFLAYPRLGSRLTILIVHCGAAPLAVITERLWLGTVLAPVQILFIVIILGGIALALAPDKANLPAQRNYLAGVPLALIACAGQGWGAVISRKAYAVAEASQFEVDGMSAAFQRILPGLAIAAFAVLIARRSMVLAHLRRRAVETAHRSWRRAWPWTMMNALAGPSLGVASFQWALQTTPTGIVLPIVALTPLVVVPLAQIMEGERPGWRAWTGGAIAVGGVIGLTTL